MARRARRSATQHDAARRYADQRDLEQRGATADRGAGGAARRGVDIPLTTTPSMPPNPAFVDCVRCDGPLRPPVPRGTRQDRDRSPRRRHDPGARGDGPRPRRRIICHGLTAVANHQIPTLLSVLGARHRRPHGRCRLRSDEPRCVACRTRSLSSLPPVYAYPRSQALFSHPHADHRATRARAEGDAATKGCLALSAGCGLLYPWNAKASAGADRLGPPIDGR